MAGFFNRRSLLFDMGMVFAAILLTAAVAGVFVQQTSQQLVSDARDAVWEASVPPAQVFTMISAEWLVREQLTSALTAEAGQAEAIARARSEGDRAEKVWRELTDMSVYFPPDVKGEVDKTSQLLSAFRAATARMEAAIAPGTAAEVRRDAVEAHSAAIRALAGQVAHLLDTMRARIDHVNQRMEDTASAGLLRLGWVALATTALIATCAAVVLFRIVRPIVRLTRSMAALAGGDLSVAIPAFARGDEIGRMAATVQVFKANALETQGLRQAQERERERAAADRHAAMLELAQRFEATIGGIAQAVSRSADDLQQSAEAMSSSADRAASRSTAVAADAEEATQNVRTAAAATDQLSRAMTAVGGETAQARDRIAAAVERARGTDEDVRRLGQAADSIGSVVGVIADIASQTNLLALNATIEAARAGAYGRGFAVVASEVKQLATETAKATTDITAQIQSMQSVATATIESVRAVCDIIADVAQITARIGAEIAGQVLATQEIAGSVSKVTERTSTVTRNIGEVNSAVQGSDRIAGGVLEAARRLSQTGNNLTHEVDRFLTSVRSA